MSNVLDGGGSKKQTPAPEPKVSKQDVSEARASGKKVSRGVLAKPSMSSSLLSGGYRGYGDRDTLG